MLRSSSRCQRGRELRRPCKSEDTGEKPVAGSIVPVAQSSRGTASRTQRLGVQVPPGIRPQKRGLRLEAGRLSYTQEEREHYLQPLRFSFRKRHWSKSKIPVCQVGDPGALPGCRTFIFPSESGMIPPHASNVSTVNSGSVVAGFKSSIP